MYSVGLTEPPAHIYSPAATAPVAKRDGAEVGLTSKITPQTRRRHWRYEQSRRVILNEKDSGFGYPCNKLCKSRRNDESGLNPIWNALLENKNQRDIFDADMWWKDSSWKENSRKNFVAYLEEINDKVILLREKDTHKPLPLEYTTRYSKRRQQKAYARLIGVKIKFGVHLTLTVDAKRYKNVIEATTALQGLWDNLRRAIEYRFKKKHLNYAKVLEFTPKNDLPHYHILIEGVFFNKNDLSWLYQETKQQREKIRPLRDVNLVYYLKKYFTKVYNDVDKIKDTQAYLYWVTNAKVYGISADLQKRSNACAIKIKEFGWFMNLFDEGCYRGYEFVGIFDENDLEPPPGVITDGWIEKNLG